MTGDLVCTIDYCAGVTPALLLGALIDAGLDVDALRAELALLPLAELSLTAERRTSQSIAGWWADIHAPARPCAADEARALSSACRLPRAGAWSQRVYDMLWADAPDTSIPLTDVLGVCAVAVGLALLGVVHVVAGPLPLPPAASAATRRLARRARLATLVDPDAPEPTRSGVALLGGFATARQPAVRLRSVGYGIGGRALVRPDLARVIFGDALEDVVPAPIAQPAPDALVVAAPTLTSAATPALEALVESLRDTLGDAVLGCAVAGQAPDLRATLGDAAARGATRITVLPLVISEADPALDDIAGVLRWAQATWPDCAFACAPAPLDADQLAGLLSRRAADLSEDSAEDAALIVLGSGAADRHANAEVARIAHLLRERQPHRMVTYAFASDGRPRLDEAIALARASGSRRVLVLPLTLLPVHTGAEISAQLAHDPILAAPPLLTTAGLAAILLQRAAEARASATHADGGGRDPLVGIRRHTHRHPHPHPATQPLADQLLPARYRDGAAVSAAPMGAADLRYDADGRVAWDAIWTDFCDLALAGGPPHRGALLEPVSADDVARDPAGYARVVQEIARGLRLVTSLEVITDGAPGWVGLRCRDEAMALWMLRAIVVENVSVRREGVVLFFPAGPSFRLEREIKNVITVVAKAHHYWTEHQQG